jgi:uncharacterized protein (DUF4415 family)
MLCALSVFAAPTNEKSDGMKKPNPYMTDEENPELTDEYFKRAVPARLIHPDWAEYSEQRKRGERGPQKAPVKQAISIRVDKDVLAIFKATGKDWQKRMNAALRMGAERLTPHVESIKKQAAPKKQSARANKLRRAHSIGSPT